MKLVKLFLKGFRGYENVEIDFNENINVIIGRNDVGKSTILEALNYFFNEEPKIDPLDCNINSVDKMIEISAAFKVNENELVLLDATNPTSLKDEFLLNEEGYLEIRKKINATNKTITNKNIYVELIVKQTDINYNPLITINKNTLKE